MKIIHVAEGFISARVVQAVYADSSWLRTVVELPGAEVAEGLPTGVTTIATCATLNSLFLLFFSFSSIYVELTHSTDTTTTGATPSRVVVASLGQILLYSSKC